MADVFLGINIALWRKQPESFTISGTGKQVRDVLHAKDLVGLYDAAYQNRNAASGTIFNIGGGLQNSLSLLELFDLLQELTAMPEPMRFERLPRRQSDQDFFVADVSQADLLLAWNPQVSSREGISRMLEWSKSFMTTHCHAVA